MSEQKRLRVLIIDDNAAQCLGLSELLHIDGMTTYTAFDGVRGLDMARALKPDAVMLDVNMPRMDGFSFLRTLRRGAADVATLPALVITTEAGEDDLRAARAAGANFYLVKPVSQQDLVRHAAILSGAPA